MRAPVPEPSSAGPSTGPKRKALRRALGRVLKLAFGCYLAAGALVFWQQRRFIYCPPVLPTPVVEEQARANQLEAWRDSPGHTIGWKRLSTRSPAQGQVLVLHGNADAAFQCAHYADSLQEVAPLDVFLIEYPGYADRPGAPSERSLYAAAEEGFALLATNAPIFLVGESLGTGVAAYLAGAHPDRVAGVVLLAPFDSLVAVGQHQMPIFPVGLMLADRFPSEEHLRGYHGPVAILVVADDQVVPSAFGRALYESYPGPKQLWESPHGGHDSIASQPRTWWREVFEVLGNASPPGVR